MVMEDGWTNLGPSGTRQTCLSVYPEFLDFCQYSLSLVVFPCGDMEVRSYVRSVPMYVRIKRGRSIPPERVNKSRSRLRKRF